MNFYKPLSFIILLILSLHILYAQSSYPLSDDSVKYRLLLDSITQKYKTDIAGLSGKNSKYTAALYKERYENLKEIFEAGGIVTIPEANNYLQLIVKEIYQNNPILKNLNSRILFSRAYWPNASSEGEGTILFNIGLFYKLQNESQAAFVICHELAHLYFNHGNKSIEQYINTIYSDEFQKQLKNIQRTPYQKQQQLEALAKNITFKNRQHGREHESEADSMAIEWLKNTPYDLTEALRCLALLDSVDNDKYNAELSLPQYFNFTLYPFQQRWLRNDAGLSAMAASTQEENKKEADSLKTHPDCSVRIAKLRDRIKQYQPNQKQKFIVSEQEFLKLKNQFDIEIIYYCYKAGLTSRCLYLCLQMLPYYKDDPFLYSLIGGCLNQCYLHQKKHELTKITDLPAPFFNKKYDSLLHFIQNLRLPEWAALSYYFTLEYQPKFMANEEFLNTLIISKEIFNKPDEQKQCIDFYHKNFPNGKYIFIKTDN